MIETKSARAGAAQREAFDRILGNPYFTARFFLLFFCLFRL